MRQANLTEAKQSEATLRDEFGEQIFKTVISRRSAVSKSLFHHVSIYDFDPRCVVADEFTSLSKEVIKIINNTTM